MASAAIDIDVWNRTCINGIETSLLCNGFCLGGNIIFNHTVVCQSGCNVQTNTCNSAAGVSDSVFIMCVAVLVSLVAFMLFIADKFKDDWGVMTILFYIMSIIFMLLTVGLVGSYYTTTQNNIQLIMNTAYYVMGALVFVFIAYIIMRFILRFAVKFTRDTASKSHG